MTVLDHSYRSAARCRFSKADAALVGSSSLSWVVNDLGAYQNGLLYDSRKSMII